MIVDRGWTVGPMDKMPSMHSGRCQGLDATKGTTKEERMYISDGELGLAMGFASRVRSDARAAQQLINDRDAEINRLRRRIAALERENAGLIAERAGRHQQRIAAYLGLH